jgi:serum/glucocorticoid-regulated kinase 2
VHAGMAHTTDSPFSDVSRQSEISIQCYLRKEEPKRGNDGLAADMGNDIFLGGIRFTPDFDDMPTQDQWYDLSGGTGRIQIGLAFKPLSVRTRSFLNQSSSVV